MRTLSITALLLILVAAPGRGALVDILVSPRDDSKLRESVLKRVDVQRLTKEYDDLCRTYLLYLRSNDLPAIFSAKLKEFPKDGVMPVFQPDTVVLISMIDESKPNRRHDDVYAVGDIGYLKFYFDQDGQTIQSVAMCFRPDASFVPLKTTANIPGRLEWEKQKSQLIQTWLKARLTKDLRQDEPFYWDDSQGKSRVLETDIRKMWRVVSFPKKNFFVPPVSAIHAAERVFNTIKLDGMTREAVAKRLHMELRSTRYDYDRPIYRVSGTTHQPFPKGTQVLKFDGGGFGFQFSFIYGPDEKLIRVEKQWIT